MRLNHLMQSRVNIAGLRMHGAFLAATGVPWYMGVGGLLCICVMLMHVCAPVCVYTLANACM